MPECLISLGSNLGDRATLLSQAAARVAALPDVASFRASRLFKTPPIGGPEGQSTFLNAVAAFSTAAAAKEVLGWLQQVELDLGRERKIRWDARSIDLDIVLYGDLTGGGSNLIVPHPRYAARRFVLQPACDVAADWIDPRFGWTLQQLSDHIQAAAPSLALVGQTAALRESLCRQVAERRSLTVVPQPPLPEPQPLAANVAVEQAWAGALARPEVWRPPEAGPWIAAFAPSLPPTDSARSHDARWPRLLVRLERPSAADRWPAPHQVFPRGGAWPEYRLEIDDFDWAVDELVSAYASLECPVQPITADGSWVPA